MSIANFIENASRIYEQECRTPSDVSSLEMYIRRRVGWAGSCIMVNTSVVGEAFSLLPVLPFQNQP